MDQLKTRQIFKQYSVVPCLTVGKFRICDDFALLSKVHERHDEVQRGNDFVLLDAKLNFRFFKNMTLESSWIYIIQWEIEALVKLDCTCKISINYAQSCISGHGRFLFQKVGCKIKDLLNFRNSLIVMAKKSFPKNYFQIVSSIWLFYRIFSEN